MALSTHIFCRFIPLSARVLILQVIYCANSTNLFYKCSFLSVCLQFCGSQVWCSAYPNRRRYQHSFLSVCPVVCPDFYFERVFFYGDLLKVVDLFFETMLIRSIDTFCDFFLNYEEVGVRRTRLSIDQQVFSTFVYFI